MSRFLKILGNILGITIFVSIVVGFVMGIYFVGFAGLFQILGVAYDSIWSLALFVVFFFMIGFVVDLLVNPLTIIIREKIQDRPHVFVLQFAIEVSANWMILHALNAIMDSVHINVLTEIIIAVFLFFAEYMFGSEDNNANDKTDE